MSVGEPILTFVLKSSDVLVPKISGLFSKYIRDKRFSAALPYIKGNILDLGCGYAGIAARLQPEQLYIGIDRNERLIALLNGRFPNHEFHVRDFDNQNIDLNEKFDTILMLAIVEHLQNPEKILCQIPQYLKDGGRLIITTPPPLGDRIHRIGARFGFFYQSAVEEHNIIFRRDTLEPILSKCGLQVDTYRKFLLGGNQLFVCSHPSYT